MSASRGRRGRGGTGEKSRLSEKRGDEVGKVKGGRERTRDCNLINPRLEVARPAPNRSGQPEALSIGSKPWLDRPTKPTWKKGDARIADQSPFIDLPRRSMRPYSYSQRPGWISRALTHPPRFRCGARSSASLIAIERTHPHRADVSRRASFEICVAEDEGGRARVWRRGGWVCLGPRARAGRRSRPAVITMQTRMLELFDEFQTGCNADGRKH